MIIYCYEIKRPKPGRRMEITVLTEQGDFLNSGLMHDRRLVSAPVIEAEVRKRNRQGKYRIMDHDVVIWVEDYADHGGAAAAYERHRRRYSAQYRQREDRRKEAEAQQRAAASELDGEMR